MKLSAYLNKNKCNSSLIKQVLRSGTNPGAMIAESKYAQSAADFIHKLSIAQKEIY
jgi:four helix bundle protein